MGGLVFDLHPKVFMGNEWSIYDEVQDSGRKVVGEDDGESLPGVPGDSGETHE